MQRRSISVLLFLSASLLAAGCASARLPSGAESWPAEQPAVAGKARILPASLRGEFPATFRWEGREFRLNGAGLCEFGFLGIDLYRAALYVEKDVRRSAAEILRCDQDLIVHLHFVRSLSRAQLCAAYDASVRLTAGDDVERYRAALGQLMTAMQDVGVGDSYTFVVQPGRELVVQRNDVELARIADEAFQQLFVRLYFGELPPDENMKRALIEGGR